MSSPPPPRAPPPCDSPARGSSNSYRGGGGADGTRPFTASAARSSSLLAVLVHYGEGLDTLLAPTLSRQQRCDSNDTDGCVSDDRLPHSSVSSFVVVSVGAFAPAGSSRVECVTIANTSRLRREEDESDEAIGTSETEVLYEPRYSPFAATRVVESCSAPAWNELLTLSLPFEWRELGPAGRHLHPRHMQHGALALKVELVQRGPSQQEDFLLATAIVPLLPLNCDRGQVRLALQFAPTAPQAPGTPAPARIFLSLRETTRDCFEGSSSEPLASMNATDRVEVLVERFVPAAAAAAEVTSGAGDGVRDTTQCQLPLRSLALALAPPSSTSAFEQELLSDLFAVVGHESDLDLLAKDIDTAVTPSATPDKLSSRETPGIVAPATFDSFWWHYPLVFELSRGVGGDGSAIDSGAQGFEVALFDTRNPQRSARVGAGKFSALHTICQSVAAASDSLLSNGDRHALAPPVPIYSVHSTTGAPPTLLGHLHATVRWWSPESWTAFVRDTPARRVVSSNRNIRKNTAMLTLGWMGALLRGLNRYPVSSFCDEGGLSSVLAIFLSASSSPPRPKVAVATQDAPPGGAVQNVEVNALLVSQISHLQAEAAAQRQQIERLQVEVDERLKAVQTCGKELVALRREVRAKDQRLEEAKTALAKAAAREQQQMEQLMAAPAPLSASYSGAMDSKLHQQLTLVLARYKELEREHQDTKAQLEATQRSLALTRDLETRYAELEQAHMVQAAQVQRLQREKQQVAELKRAVRLQEKVIQQFEAAVSLESAGELAAKSAAAAAAASPSHAQQHATSSLAPASASGGCSDALLSVRVRVLEEQLATNARDAASEIGRLKMRILELETGSRLRRPSS